VAVKISNSSRFYHHQKIGLIMPHGGKRGLRSKSQRVVSVSVRTSPELLSYIIVASHLHQNLVNAKWQSLRVSVCSLYARACVSIKTRSSSSFTH
jgi:hypothetical protein